MAPLISERCSPFNSLFPCQIRPSSTPRIPIHTRVEPRLPQPRIVGSISNDPLVPNPPGAVLIPIVDVTNKATTLDDVRRSTAVTVMQGAHGFTEGMALHNNGGTWAKSKADAIATARVDGVVSPHNLAAGSFVVVSGGALTTSPWIPNTQYYLSDATAGLLTPTPPTALTSFIVPVARAGTATSAVVHIGEPLSLAKIPDSALENPGGGGVGPPGPPGAGAVEPGIVAMFLRSAMPASLPAGWIECDGANGTTNEADVGAMAVVIRHDGTVATPAFDIPAGSYGSAQTITITCATSGVVIKYTTDGSTPSRSVGTVYSTPVPIAATATLKAIAYRVPTDPTLTMIDSAVQSAVYTISAGDVTPPTLTTAIIPPAGTTIMLFFDEIVQVGGGGSGGVTLAMSGGAVTATLASGTGTNTLHYTLSRTVVSGETGTVSYAQPGNGIQDNSPAGNDVASFSGAAITNNSTATGGGTPGWVYSHPPGVLTVQAGTGDNTLWQKITATFTGNVDKLSVYQAYVNAAGKTIKMALYNAAGTAVLGSGVFVTTGYAENADIEVTLDAPVAVVNGQDYWIGWTYSDNLIGQIWLDYGGSGSESGISYDFLYPDFPEVPVAVTGTARYRVGMRQV